MAHRDGRHAAAVGDSMPEGRRRYNRMNPSRVIAYIM